MRYIKKYEDINNDWMLTDMDLSGYYQEISCDTHLNNMTTHINANEIDDSKFKRIKNLLKSNEGEKLVSDDNKNCLHISGRFILNSTHPNATFHFEAIQIENDQYSGSFNYKIDGQHNSKWVSKCFIFDDWGGVLRFLKDNNIIK